jgi:hypothetical protein
MLPMHFDEWEKNSKSLDLKTQETKQDDDFQIITPKEVRQSQQEMDADRLYKRIYKTNEDLLKSSIKLENSEHIAKQKSWFWTRVSSSLSNFKNSLKFNLITTNTQLDFRALNYVRLFDKIFSDQDIKRGQVNTFLKTVFQFTYRSDFTPIEHQGRVYITDCGWGCMIRAAQMMMAKGVLEKKLYDIRTLYGVEINDELLLSTKVDTLLLFFDNYLRLDDIAGNKDFAMFIKGVKNIINEEEKKLREAKRLESNIESIMNNNDFHKDTDNECVYVSEITAPFSIQNICKLGTLYDKGPGIWFSEVIMSNIFSELNFQFKTIDMEFFTYTEGVVYENELIENCFEKLKCDCDTGQDMPLEEFINNIFEDNICNTCLESYKADDIYAFKGKYYKFKKGAFIFVSVRLGLSSIDIEYNDTIFHIFKIPLNLGIIGGKCNSAHYFIGETANKLIYLDPHINLQASKDRLSLETDDIETYNPRYFYITDITTISPAFTIGFHFRDLDEYKQLTEGFKIHNSFKYPVFKFCEDNKTKTQNVKDVVLEEDDFCMVNYDN